MMTDDEVRTMCDVRARDYGDPRLGFEGLGMIWTGILQTYYQARLPETIPPHIAALMMAAMKVSRASKGFKEDNYDDLKNFSAFAREFHRNDVADEQAMMEAVARAVSQHDHVCQNGK